MKKTKVMVLDQVHAVHGHPRRRMEVGSYVRRRGPVSERDVAIVLGIELGSAAKTLALMVADGIVSREADGRYSWTGGDLLLRWADLTEQRRRVLMHLSTSGRISTTKLADGAGMDAEAVRNELPALEKAGWIEREDGKQLGSHKKPVKVSFSWLSPAAAEAIAGLGKVEASRVPRPRRGGRRPGDAVICERHSPARYLDHGLLVTRCSVCGAGCEEPSDLAGLAARESAGPITARPVTGTASPSRLALTLDGRRLVGADLGGPGERWIMEVGGRVVGTTSGAGQARIALLWLLTGDGLT